MVVTFTAEKKLEDDLINQLIRGESQWIYRDDLRSEEALWNNVKVILERNNRAELKGKPLTEQEFWQVRTQLTFVSFFEAAKWLSGENGIAKVQVQREDASLGTIRLNVINNHDIAGGTSVYEVINQCLRDKESDADQKRIFDVTLLVNGLPMIHIELKNRQHPYMDAFRQIKKYLKADKFKGIYSSTQMFVVSNGSDTRYIASNSYKVLNEKFLSQWVDLDNKPVNDYLVFAKDVLSIPQAHKMVAHYAITDRDALSLILLRPYQIHAIELIKKASCTQKSGFVWHTTGSGKTLTSYKVACNLLQIPSIDKTIFIVDRIDLDQQTSSSFASYAEFDPVSINETDNVNALITKLTTDDRTVVITTIQKIDHLMKRMAQDNLSDKQIKQFNKIRELKLAFIVDECHRAVTPQKKREIVRIFHYALWYGFTGTPIFKENMRAELGDLERTTEQQYGKCLHTYTVKEAINDAAVLGFQVEYKHTLNEDMINNIVAHHYPKKNLNELNNIEKEKLIPKDVYDSEAHQLAVIDSIINKSRSKLGMTTDGGVGKAYGAILTVPSIAIAQKYYSLFKSVIAEESSIKISEKVRSILPDFPKVAITYSVSENEDSSIINQQKMAESIADYNASYGTSFSLETIRAYNQNINKRLARKEEKYKNRAEQIDLIIVVDRLLTGFDAPCISTLFIDRPPMRLQDIIQAFSRTNRLFDKGKTYGHIVTFQTPKLYTEAVNKALVLYSNGGENYVLAPTFNEAQERLKNTIQSLKSIVASPDGVDQLSTEAKRKFAKAYQEFDKTLNAISVYYEFTYEMLPEIFKVTNEEIEAYYGKYVNVIEQLRNETNPDPDIEPLDIEYELQTHHVEEINYLYILSLIQRFMPSETTQPQLYLIDEEQSNQVDEYLASMQKDNPKLALIMFELWEKIKKDPESYRGQNIQELLNTMISETIDHLVNNFSVKWSVQVNELQFVVDNYNPNKEVQNGENELKNTSDYLHYKEHTENPVSKLKYWSCVKEAYTQMIKESILPLRAKA